MVGGGVLSVTALGKQGVSPNSLGQIEKCDHLSTDAVRVDGFTQAKNVEEKERGAD